MNLDELFKSWNLATYKSIETQTEISEKDSKLALFKVQNDIVEFDKINKNAIRYKFLEKLSNQYLNISNYYIIETAISGEYYQPRIFVMYSRNQKSTNVFKYEYINKKWEYIDSFLLPYYFKYNYKDYVTNHGKETNQHDITVTQIINNKVVKSDFFSTGTMSKFVFELPEFANHF